jgi:PAS domain S-box-containing protein
MKKNNDSSNNSSSSSTVSKLSLLQAAEKNRQNVESHLMQSSGDLKSIFRELQIHLVELEFQNEALRKASAECAKSQQNFQELFEHAPVGYCVFSQIGIVLNANSTCCRLLGLDRSQVVGRSFGRFVHPEAHEKFFTHLEKLGSGIKNKIELKMVIAEKTTRHVLMESAAQPGHPDIIISALIDVSERYWAFDRLHDNEDKYRLLFREMVSGAIIVDVRRDESGNPIDALILDVNPAFERTTGVTRKSAVGKCIMEIFPQTEPYWFEALSDTPRLGKPTQLEAFHRQLKRFFSIKAFRLNTGHVVIMGMDITGKKKSEQQAKDELEIKIEARTAKLEDSVDALVKQIEKRGKADQHLMQANEKLTARAGQLRQLSGELVLAEHRERRRLSELVNGNLQKHLLSVRTRLAIVRDQAADTEISVEMGRIDALLEESMQMAKSLSEDMSPPLLDQDGLGAWLKWLAQWIKDRHGLVVDLHLDGEYHLPKDVLVMIFESVRELLFNVVKHAKVPRAVVRVQQIESEALRISVRDEGVGFDINVLAHGDAFVGLLNIRRRINLIGGKVYIDSAPAKGSRLTIIIPFSQKTKEEGAVMISSVGGLNA